jgi:hypothetical protein
MPWPLSLWHFFALLQGMVDAAAKNTPARYPTVGEPPLSILIDVSSNDLEPFVTLRREHQTEEARTGVRT